MEYKDGDITSEIIATAMEVHNNLGCGFPEIIYQRAMQYEFNNRNINAQQEAEVPIYYKDIIRSLQSRNRIVIKLRQPKPAN